LAAAYRTHVSIIADILQIARECSYERGNGGASVTYLIRRANVPHQRLSSIVSLLKQGGLLQELPKESRYRISEKGLEFLNAYSSFKGFAETFGLRI
jgi:predicted transcriptional regulator